MILREGVKVIIVWAVYPVLQRKDRTVLGEHTVKAIVQIQRDISAFLYLISI